MKNLDKAKLILSSDGVVGIPTETVYGLAANINSEKALAKIFETKERPFFDPLIVHVCSKEQAKKYCSNWTSVSDILADRFWPGPLTLIQKKNELINPLITSGLETVGLRVPNTAITLKLIEDLGCPLAAPSANKFKQTSPTKAEHVREVFPDLLVLDGGDCEIGIESTILEIFDSEIIIYRPGMITKEVIQECLVSAGVDLPIRFSESPVAPGHLKHHYMPKLPVILLKGGDKLSQFDTSNVPKDLMSAPCFYHLDQTAELTARSLYQNLRVFDKGHTSIVLTISNEKLIDEKWSGILNRIQKAASYKLSK
jgi:L-threonylcarbamoyladenylate synthase